MDTPVSTILTRETPNIFRREANILTFDRVVSPASEVYPFTANQHIALPFPLPFTLIPFFAPREKYVQIVYIYIYEYGYIYIYEYGGQLDLRTVTFLTNSSPPGSQLKRCYS